MPYEKSVLVPLGADETFALITQPDRLRRWQKQGKLSKSRGRQKSRFPDTASPRAIARLIRRGVLQNARFAAAVLVTGVQRGPKEDVHVLMRSDVLFPSLYTIRGRGLFTTPVAFATAHVAAQFVKFFPRKETGVFAPETLPIEVRREILAGEIEKFFIGDLWQRFADLALHLRREQIERTCEFSILP